LANPQEGIPAVRLRDAKQPERHYGVIYIKTANASFVLPVGDINCVIFYGSFVDGQAIAAQGETIAGFQVETVTVPPTGDDAIVGGRAFQWRILMGAEAADGIAASLMQKYGALSAVVTKTQAEAILEHFQK